MSVAARRRREFASKLSARLRNTASEGHYVMLGSKRVHHVRDNCGELSAPLVPAMQTGAIKVAASSIARTRVTVAAASATSHPSMPPVQERKVAATE